MKKQTNVTINAYIIQCVPYLLLLAAGTVMALFVPQAPTKVSHPAGAALTFAERVSYQRAIEEVYWRHRIWPKENLSPKPPLDAVMSQAQLENKVTEYLRNSQALENDWERPITPEQLQAEMERMAQHTKQPEVLRELFAALGNDPFVIAECLARAVLLERLQSANVAQTKKPLESWSAKARDLMPNLMVVAIVSYTLPAISDQPSECVDNWTATNTTSAPLGRFNQTAVWTGSEMIVWGGIHSINYFNGGGRYCPQMGAAIALNAARRKVEGINTVHLTWSGASSEKIDVYRCVRKDETG